MINSKPSDAIEDFIDFYERICGRAKASRRSGAPKEQIEEFATLCGMTLPLLYVGYLEHFGTNDGFLKLGDRGDPRLGELLEFYHKQTTLNRNWVPARTVLFSREGPDSSGRGLYYGDALEEPIVVQLWFTNTGTVGSTVAACFRNYLYSQAFVRGCFPPSRLAAALHSKDKQMTKEMSSFAGSCGFVPYWFSDDYQSCMEQERDCILISQADDGATIFIISPSRQARERLKNKFMKQLNLTDVSPQG